MKCRRSFSNSNLQASFLIDENASPEGSSKGVHSNFSRDMPHKVVRHLVVGEVAAREDAKVIKDVEEMKGDFL